VDVRSAPGLRPSCAVAVGHAEDEETLALMRRANFRRAEESSLNLKAQALKVSVDAFGAAAGEHAADVLDEDPPGAGLDDDPPRRAPEISLVLFGEALSGDAVGLARDAANEAIHKATPRSAAEGSGIAMQRRWSQETRSHRFDQVSAGEGFPLHHSDRSSTRDDQLGAEVEASTSGAEADVVEGWSVPGT
jgi:hypothetical protein